MATGSGTLKLPEIHAGSRTGFPVSPSAVTLNAMTLPSGVGPWVTGKWGADFETGPYMGTYNQVPPSSSRHIESPPQIPWDVLDLGSFPSLIPASKGVWWSFPPSESASSRYKTPSFAPLASKL